MPLMGLAATSGESGWSVRCAACGSCCNSAPLMSLPELFRHQHLFIGALGLRRVRRVRTGETLARGNRAYQATAEDRAAVERLAANCLHPIPVNEQAECDLLLSPLGFDDPGLGRCPALGPDAGCTLHSRHKPAMCRAVPYGPLMPDRLQHLVLAERWAESDELGARCIARTKDPQRMSVRGDHVLDGEARRALGAARQALAADKRCWGNAISAQLAADPEGVARIPAEGLLVLPLAPVLELIAGVSEHCRARCLDFLDAQTVLCMTSAQAREPAGGPTLARLRTFLRANHAVRDALLARRPARPTCNGVSARDVEGWLEHTEPEVSVFLGGRVL